LYLRFNAPLPLGVCSCLPARIEELPREMVS
jgi:hypothetical protein